MSNAWAKQTSAQNDKTGSETRQMRPDLSYANFQMDPSLAQAGFGIAGGRLGAWNPADPSPPTTISTDSPETSTSSGTSNLEPSPGPVGQDNTSFSSSGSNDFGGQHGGNGFAPLPSPSSFLPPFSPSAFFSSNNSFPFPAPSPLSNNQLPPFSPGQFLSQFNFGESPAHGQSTFPVSPGAENHPEAGFLFDGLLSPNSLNSILALPSPSTLGFSTTTASSDEESNRRASLRNMEEEELRLIEGGAWLVPEKKMLSSEGGLRGQRGRFDEYTVSPMDPFYIDPQKFGGCYGTFLVSHRHPSTRRVSDASSTPVSCSGRALAAATYPDPHKGRPQDRHASDPSPSLPPHPLLLAQQGPRLRRVRHLELRSTAERAQGHAG